MDEKQISKKPPYHRRQMERRHHTGPPEPTKPPVCTQFPLCKGCPFPGHGFLCWGADGECMRTRIEKQNGKDGSI